MEINSSAYLIASVIGSVSTIICAKINNNKEKNRDESATSERRKVRMRKNVSLLTVLSIISFIFAIICVSAFAYTQFGPKPKPQIEITSPKENDLVEQTLIVKGYYNNIPNEQKLWIVIYPLKVNRYYPQNSFANLEAANKWTSIAYVGQKNDIGQQFEIIAVLVDKKANDEIESYLANAKNKQDWPGLEKLPEGAVTYCTINVKRK